MCSQSLPVSGTSNVFIADELGHRIPSLKGQDDGLELGRTLVNKIKKEAQRLMTPFSAENVDLIAQVHRIDATLCALEKLQNEGLASPNTSKVLLLVIADMAQRFLLCYKTMCREATDQVLSEGF